VEPDCEQHSVIDQWLNAPAAGLPAVVNWAPEEDHATLSAGFENAAHILAGGWQTLRDDGVVVPIIYLYRHAVELTLKATITSATSFLDRVGELPEDCVLHPDLPRWLRGQGGRLDSPWKLSPGHNLDQLTRYLQHLITLPQLFPGEESGLEPGGWYRRLLAELHDLDPDGSGLRYPTRWNALANAQTRTRRPGVPDEGDLPERNILLDVDLMSQDFQKLLGRLGAINDRVTEERLKPLSWERDAQ